MKADKFTSIVSRFRPQMLAIAYQFDADRDAAEDAVQEALMRLWIAREKLSETTDVERLAVRLTKHACIDAYRKRQQQQKVELKEVTATAPGDAIREAELQRALEKAVSALPPAERKMWAMFAEAQMDSAQIATVTGIAVRSVSSMLSSARRRIVESLKKGGAL